MKNVNFKRLKAKTKLNNIFFKRKTDSTFNDSRKLLLKGEATPFLVAAQMQSGARGRLNRSFYCYKGGIYMCVVFNMYEQTNPLLVTPAAAVAVCRALKNILNIDVKIKWVNDIFYNGKKLCGILTERTRDKNDRDSIIVGIGINFITPKTNFPDNLKDTVTSATDFETKGMRENLIAQICNGVLELCNNTTNLIEEYKKLSLILNSTIYINGVERALAVDIDDLGALIVEKDGKLLRLDSGEVSVRLKKE